MMWDDDGLHHRIEGVSVERYDTQEKHPALLEISKYSEKPIATYEFQSAVLLFFYHQRH
jgi:hypothetical protein